MGVGACSPPPPSPNVVGPWATYNRPGPEATSGGTSSDKQPRGDQRFLYCVSHQKGGMTSPTGRGATSKRGGSRQVQANRRRANDAAGRRYSGLPHRPFFSASIELFHFTPPPWFSTPPPVVPLQPSPPLMGGGQLRLAIDGRCLHGRRRGADTPGNGRGRSPAYPAAGSCGDGESE